jgi:hypothetical protein
MPIKRISYAGMEKMPFASKDASFVFFAGSARCRRGIAGQKTLFRKHPSASRR